MADIMRQSILEFPKQLVWKPELENARKLKMQKSIIIAGMGGSALAGGFLKMLIPKRTIVVHRNYGLPHDAHPHRSCVIVVSYSGNTEETIDAFRTARKKNIPCAVIATGGKLLKLAQRSRIPFIQLPTASRVQPRTAMGFILKALVCLLHEKTLERDLEKAGRTLQPTRLIPRANIFARKLFHAIPVLYASETNEPLARTLKIKFNETGKIPAFWNVLPELNHNEMTGFDWNKKTRPLSQGFSFIFLEDKNDAPRIKKRMTVLKRILEEKRFRVFPIPFTSASIRSVFETMLFGDWIAYYLAKSSGANPNTVPLVEKFKKLIA